MRHVLCFCLVLLLGTLHHQACGQNKAAAFFSDEAGQLLVKRSLLYLYAGEDRNAWSTLEQGVRQHHGSTRGLGRIKSEIKRILEEAPF